MITGGRSRRDQRIRGVVIYKRMIVGDRRRILDLRHMVMAGAVSGGSGLGDSPQK